MENKKRRREVNSDVKIEWNAGDWIRIKEEEEEEEDEEEEEGESIPTEEDEDEQIPIEISRMPEQQQIPQIDFKRPHSIDCPALISTWYKLSVLEDVRNVLSNIGGEDKLNRFLRGCFGHFLYWQPGHKCSMVLHHVLSREIRMPDAWDHDMYFHIKGVNLRFSCSEYALMTGLNFGYNEFRVTDVHDVRDVAIRQRYCGQSEITVDTLHTAFCNANAETNVDELLQVAHILVLYLFVLGYAPVRYVEAWVWKLADNLDVFSRFPWRAYSYKTLRYYIKNIVADKPKYKVGGAVWAFLTWALEVIPDLGSAAGVLDRPTAYPRCIRWKFVSRPAHDLTPIFYQQADRLREIVTDNYESSAHYFLSSMLGTALMVQHLEPINPLRAGQPFPQGSRPIGNRRSQTALNRRPQRAAPVVDVAKCVTEPEVQDVEIRGTSTVPDRHAPATKEKRKSQKQQVVNSSSSSSADDGGCRGSGVGYQQVLVSIEEMRAEDQRRYAEQQKRLDELQNMQMRQYAEHQRQYAEHQRQTPDFVQDCHSMLEFTSFEQMAHQSPHDHSTYDVGGSSSSFQPTYEHGYEPGAWSLSIFPSLGQNKSYPDSVEMSTATSFPFMAIVSTTTLDVEPTIERGVSIASTEHLALILKEESHQTTQLQRSTRPKKASTAYKSPFVSRFGPPIGIVGPPHTSYRPNYSLAI